MAAIIEMPRPNTRPFAPQTDPVREQLPARPPLAAVQGRRSAEGRRRRRMYLRRRLAALLGVAVFVAAAWVSFSNPVPTTGAPAVEAVGAEHVVQRGDTLWTIARGLGVDGDVRDTVGALADANGGAVLVPGQVLVIPAQLRQ